MNHFLKSLRSIAGIQNIPTGMVGKVVCSAIGPTDPSISIFATYDHTQNDRIRLLEIAHGIAYDHRADAGAFVVCDHNDGAPATAVRSIKKTLRHTGKGSRHRTMDGAESDSLEHLSHRTWSEGGNVACKVGNQIGAWAGGLIAECHYGYAIALTEVADRRLRHCGYALNGRTHFAAGVEEQNYVQRFFLVSKVQDGLRPPAVGYPKTLSCETRYELAILANLSVHVDKRNVAVECRLILCKQ